MDAPDHPSLRRRVWRLLLIVVIDAAALLLLSELLHGFALAGPATAFSLAVALGLANAVVWPLLIRFALPFTVMTFGLGALFLNAVILLAAAAVADSVDVQGLDAALAVVLGLTALTSIIGGILALDSGDLWEWHVVRRQLGRTQLQSDSDVPGILFIEIDGLSHDVVRRALRDGNLPGLARRLADGSHRLEHWETDWSSQTGACQAGILHGNNHDMPAFRWWEKDRGAAIVTNHPRDAAEIERRRSDGKGLLHDDGASRANILSGDAPHSMLTMSTVLNRDRVGRLGQDYFAYFASPYGVARTLLNALLDVGVERWAAVQQRRHDVLPRIARGWSYAFVRAYATVIQLDLQVAAVTADVLAGRPVIYTTFLAYDEVAHHSGIERPDTLAVLRRVDRAITRIESALPYGARPYEVVVLSDHGQSQGATFLQRYGETLEDVVRRHGATTGEIDAQESGSDEGRGSLTAGLAELADQKTPAGQITRVATRDRGKHEPEPNHFDALPEVSVMASGNLGLITFPREPGRVTFEQLAVRRPELLEALRTHPGVGFVLVRSESDGPLALGPKGQMRLRDGEVEGVDPLAEYGPRAREHVLRTDAFPHCPDLMVQGHYWTDLDEVAAFEELVGSHGGLGGGQTTPFVIFSSALPWPDEPVVGAETLHRVLRGWLARLGHESYAGATSVQDSPGLSTTARVPGAESAS